MVYILHLIASGANLIVTLFMYSVDASVANGHSYNNYMAWCTVSYLLLKPHSVGYTLLYLHAYTL